MFFRVTGALLILSNLFLVGMIQNMSAATPAPTGLVLTAAYKSYFVACIDTFNFIGYPKDDAIVICKENSLNYLRELTSVIGEENFSVPN